MQEEVDREQLGPLLDLLNVGDGQAIEEVHQDDNYEEDEGEEVKIAEMHQAALSVYWNAAELQFSHKHGERFHKCQKGTVEERLKSLLLLPLGCVGGIIGLLVLSGSLEKYFMA